MIIIEKTEKNNDFIYFQLSPRVQYIFLLII